MRYTPAQPELTVSHPPSIHHAVLNLLSARKGHFLLESGHHGDLWLDLELLCQRPKLLQPLAEELAGRLQGHNIDHICGPLVEGAFLALLVASALDVEFSYAERFTKPTNDALFPAGYRVPTLLRATLKGKRVALVNDVINAGSSMRGTIEDLESCGATVAVIATLLTLGPAARQYATAKNIPLETLATLPNHLWTPDACPLCTSGTPLQNIAGFGTG